MGLPGVAYGARYPPRVRPVSPRSINTGIAHKKAGIGQVGAGTVRAPLDCFVKAFEAAAEKLGIDA